MNPIYQSFQKISNGNPFLLRMDGKTDVRTDSGDTICPHIENSREIKMQSQSNVKYMSRTKRQCYTRQPAVKCELSNTAQS